MGLCGAVDQQRPTLCPVGIADQLGHAMVDLGSHRGPGDPVRAVAHPLILPIRYATELEPPDVTWPTHLRDSAFLA